MITNNNAMNKEVYRTNKSDIKKLNEFDKLSDMKDSYFINAKLIGTDYSYKHQIVWKNAIGFLIIHLMALYGFYLGLTGGIGWKSALWSYLVLVLAQEGVTIGAHRLFTHKSFKATPLLKAILILFQTVSGQNSMFIWCRDHRLHHRYSDTDADPHNAKRGFFFSHIGWLMHKKHPYVIELGKKIDMKDLEADWMVQFQKKYYYVLYVLLSIVIPTVIPVIYFGESWLNSFLFCYAFRFILLLNGTWLVNSAAHIYGTRPYDKKLQPVESWFVSFISFGEGWHNYHHAFPWDYKAAEWGMHFNQSAAIIRFFEKIGMAWDLKTASPDMVKNRILNTGDGTHYELGDKEIIKSECTAFGPLHPLNPFFTTKYNDPDAVLKPEGLPLFHEKDIFDVNVLKRKVTSA